MFEFHEFEKDAATKTSRYFTSTLPPSSKLPSDARANKLNTAKPDEASDSITNDAIDTGEAITDRPALGLAQSPLRQLPAELRLQIYELVLGNATFVIVRDEIEPAVIQCPTYPTQHPVWGSELLRTCHQVYAEAADIIFKKNVFDIRTWSLLNPFADMVGRQRFDKIRNIQLNITKHALHGPSTTCSHWYPLWITLSRMTNLRRLVVWINYWHAYSLEVKHAEDFLPILEPIYLLKGISEFKLDFECNYCPFFRQPELLALPATTLTMTRDIQKSVKEPKTESYGGVLMLSCSPTSLAAGEAPSAGADSDDDKRFPESTQETENGVSW
ncbi:MAG: hypothetical protein LQ337_002740 [Flavoplaca oasis]|nr:MAG: hypothetical protein LQ337_002740 [Flavoplaca oasis]